MTPIGPVAAGQTYEQARPAPGYAAVSYVVLGEAERAGWWRVSTSLGGQREIPGRALQNPDVYRLVAAHVNEPDSWAAMTKPQRVELMRKSLEDGSVRGPESRERIMVAFEKHFRGDPIDDVSHAMNVMLREAWRDDHDGDVAEWDRVAAASGLHL